MITASVVQDWMYRGSTYTLVANILKSVDGDLYEIPPTAVAKLRLSIASPYPYAVLEKEASHYSREQGMVHFTFEPVDTDDLLAIAYDLTIHLEDGVDVYPVYKGRFGIVDTNEEVTS